MNPLLSASSVQLTSRQQELLDYLRGYALPNFYFHATTAYDLLRHAGVALGKRDFLG